MAFHTRHHFNFADVSQITQPSGYHVSIHSDHRSHTNNRATYILQVEFYKKKPFSSWSPIEEPMDLYLIAAVTSDLGIAHQGSVPWDLPGDMKHFKKITTQTSDPTKRNAVLMGRKTWYGLDSQHRPLSGRLNIVLSRHFQISETEDTKCCRSMQEALKLLARSSDIEKVFVIGGASVFKQCIRMSACKRLYLTEISSTFQCDTFFPKFDRKVFRPISLPEIDEEVQKEGGVEYHFVCYQRKPNALLQLLNRFFQ